MAIVRERPFTIADPTIFPASPSELHGLSGPMDQLYGARFFDQQLVLEGPGLGWLGGLGANCPEGSGRTAVYTGPEGPDGCRCSPGRVWLSGRCQSPQSVAQQAGASFKELGQQYSTPEAWATQPLSAAAKNYFAMTKHSVACKIVKGAVVPGQISSDVMMCSIDGGPYIHGAYGLNLNPETAILSEISRKSAEQVSAATGVPNVWNVPELTAQVVQSTKQQGKTLTQAIQEALTPPASSSPASTWTDDAIPVPPPGAGGDAAGDVMGWNTGGSQYEIFGVGVPPALTEEWIAGIPNWLVLAAALGGAYYAFKD